MLVFIVSLIIAILLHELGHFFAAKRSGCGVDMVSIGFGKPFFRFKFRKVIYQFSWIMLGGYCSLSGELEYTKSKIAFTNLPYRNKCYISLAGIAVNCISGLISFLLWSIFPLYSLYIFGWLSIALGLSNLIPLPALDGSYPLLFLLEKGLGKKEGLKVVRRAVEVGMVLVNILNVVCVIIIVYVFVVPILTSWANYVILLLKKG